ncbi:MAG: hypothetical protein HC882_07220 [Acidobacteria bacterium]|nr:hypothetical protein [Acidobacteriota bacterium]
MAYVFASSHYHLLVRVDNARQLSDFMCYFNGNLAKELARKTGWDDKVWARRYRSIVISDEEEMQVARLKYVLAHGVKEGLVARVEEWPGVHCAVPLMTGASVEGTWFDRTLEYNAFLRGKELEPGASASREAVEVSPLPCWEHLAAEEYRVRIADLVREINEAGAAARAESQIPPLGPEVSGRRTPRPVPGRSRSRPRRSAMPCGRRSGRRCGRPTGTSWLPTARRRRSCERETGPWSSLRGASRPGCRSWRPEAARAVSAASRPPIAEG